MTPSTLATHAVKTTNLTPVVEVVYEGVAPLDLVLDGIDRSQRLLTRSCLLPVALHRIAQQDPHAHAAVMTWVRGDTGPDHACLMVAAALYESKADIFRDFADHLRQCSHAGNECRARHGLPQV